MRLTIAQLDKIRAMATNDVDGKPLSEHIHVEQITENGGFGPELDGAIAVSVTRYTDDYVPGTETDELDPQSPMVRLATERCIVNPGGNSGFWGIRWDTIPRTAMPARPRFGATHG